MQFHEIPERLLSSQTAARVLRVLMRYPNRPMTGREIAALSGAPPPRVIERLRQFESEGLVSVRGAGAADIWSVEPEHVLVPALTHLFHAEGNAQRELRSALRN